MKNIDDYFQEVAYSMGFKPEDLLPIDRQVVQLESSSITKGMSQKQKQFYINKKMTTLMQRQNHLFREVQIQIKKRQFTYKLSKDKNSNLHNPAVKKLLDDHEKIISNNKRYIDTIFKKKMIDKMQDERRKSRSSERNRLTKQSFRGNQSSISNNSRQSVRSNKTSISNRSIRSTDSTREKLTLLRQKQKQQEQIKRRAINEKQERDSKKFIRAIQNNSRKSQRAKVKSDVSKQIVQENRKQLQQFKNKEVQDHLERLKFKIQKTEMIRNRNAERRDSRANVLNQSNIDQMKKKAEDQIKLKRSKIDQKYRTVETRQQNLKNTRNQARNFNKMVSNIKSDNAQKMRQYKINEDQQFLDSVVKIQEYRLRTAEVNRNTIQSFSKERYMERDIKHDMARKNIESVNNRRFRQTQEWKKKLDSKFNEIEEIKAVRTKLTKDRQKYKKDISFQRKSMEVSNYKPKFNSFFDI